MNGLTIPFDNVYDEDKWNAEKNKYENDDNWCERDQWSKDETIEDYYYNFDDNITEMLETDEPLINDLIRGYIWNDICKEEKNLLKMFKIIYEKTEQISFTFYNSNHSSSRFNNIGFFELWNDITHEINYFIIKDYGISTSSQMSIWIGELYEEYQEYQKRQAEEETHYENETHYEDDTDEESDSDSDDEE